MRPVAAPFRTAHQILPDPSRVVTRPYVPGEEPGGGEPRIARLVRRVLAVPRAEAEARLDAVLASFGDRHRDLEATLEANYEQVADHLADGAQPTRAQRLLVGAYVTHEFTIQAAALFNPSMVPVPDAQAAAAGEQRFVMSVRAVGEGHMSSIEFRGGVVGPGGTVRFDDVSPYAATGAISYPEYDRGLFEAKLDELGADFGLVRHITHRFAEHFTLPQLERRLGALPDEGISPAAAHETAHLARMLALSNYVVSFPPALPLSERVLFPVGPTEHRGMEDARFVALTQDDGSVVFYATYTAFDGTDILPQLIETSDFAEFRIATLNGPGARNKGMALFPRKIGGQYVALSRYDKENIDIMFSGRVRFWTGRERLRAPVQPWELVQIGNCGSPLETEAGWLVLTHGVGPMRTYAIGALLLDLDDPCRVVGALEEPLLEPDEQERDGYVPNVLYSCGGMLHDGQLILPYGFSDAGIRVAVTELAGLLERLSGQSLKQRSGSDPG